MKLTEPREIKLPMFPLIEQGGDSDPVPSEVKAFRSLAKKVLSLVYVHVYKVRH